VKPRGTIKIVDLKQPSVDVMRNYAEGLVSVDKDNNYIPCLAEDWRWTDDRTIEFKLRENVRFHNGEKFNAEAVRINWEAYREMENPRVVSFTNLPDETIFEVINEYIVRFTLPKPDGLAMIKFGWFYQVAPAFFKKHRVPEKNWLYFPEAGPWGTGPFKLVEGGVPYSKPTGRLVLEAFEHYWDRDYPKIQRMIFENTLIGKREEAMRHCREKEGEVDVVSFIRPLDTLKISESPFSKVVKSKDVNILMANLNQRKKNSKWRDIRLRRAVNYAINRAELWNYAAKGNAWNPKGFLLPPGAFGHNPDIVPYEYNTEKARTLLAEGGYPDGFQLEIITTEALKLEAQIVGKMLERIGLQVKLDVFSSPNFYRRWYIPLLEKPPEEQDWDLALLSFYDIYAHTGAGLLTFGFTEESDIRWIEYDSVYEKMWEDMSRTVDREEQEKKIQELEKYAYDRAYALFIYSPITLYAVNKEVDFVPQKDGWLRLKETSVTDRHWSVR